MGDKLLTRVRRMARKGVEPNKLRSANSVRPHYSAKLTRNIFVPAGCTNEPQRLIRLLDDWFWPLADPQIIELRVFRMTASEKSGRFASRNSLEKEFNIFGVERLLSPIAVAQIAPIGGI